MRPVGARPHGQTMPLADAWPTGAWNAWERSGGKIELDRSTAEKHSGFAELGGPDEWKPSASAVAQTTRILREAVNNIIKQRRAARPGQLGRKRTQRSIRDFGRGIQDNGKGIPLRCASIGMISMKRRAKSIQGQCLVESGPGYGTVIRATVPLRNPWLYEAQGRWLASTGRGTAKTRSSTAVHGPARHSARCTRRAQGATMRPMNASPVPDQPRPAGRPARHARLASPAGGPGVPRVADDRVHHGGSPDDAREVVKVQLALLDLGLPDGSGVGVVARLLRTAT